MDAALLPHDHSAPEPTLALTKASCLGSGRVRPPAWCSWRRSGAPSPGEAPRAPRRLRPRSSARFPWA